jgi:Flp pilus assembly protein TadG
MPGTERVISCRQRRSRPAAAGSRRGAVVVELAVCLPILVAVGFGMTEACNLVFVKARLQSAAFESVRLATRPTTATNLAATAAQVQASCTTLLTQLGVQGATVVISPSSLANLAPQTLVTVTISAPISNNSVTSMVLSNSLAVSASATMIIE